MEYKHSGKIFGILGLIFALFVSTLEGASNETYSFGTTCPAGFNCVLRMATNDKIVAASDIDQGIIHLAYQASPNVWIALDPLPYSGDPTETTNYGRLISMSVFGHLAVSHGGRSGGGVVIYHWNERNLRYDAPLQMSPPPSVTIFGESIKFSEPYLAITGVDTSGVWNVFIYERNGRDYSLRATLNSLIWAQDMVLPTNSIIQNLEISRDGQLLAAAFLELDTNQGKAGVWSLPALDFVYSAFEVNSYDGINSMAIIRLDNGRGDYLFLGDTGGTTGEVLGYQIVPGLSGDVSPPLYFSRRFYSNYGAAVVGTDEGLLVISNPENNEVEIYYVDEGGPGFWNRREIIFGNFDFSSPPFDRFGESVAISRSTLAVGDPGEIDGRPEFYIYDVDLPYTPPANPIEPPLLNPFTQSIRDVIVQASTAQRDADFAFEQLSSYYLNNTAVFEGTTFPRYFYSRLEINSFFGVQASNETARGFKIFRDRENLEKYQPRLLGTIKTDTRSSKSRWVTRIDENGEVVEELSFDQNKTINLFSLSQVDEEECHLCGF